LRSQHDSLPNKRKTDLTRPNAQRAAQSPNSKSPACTSWTTLNAGLWNSDFGHRISDFGAALANPGEFPLPFKRRFCHHYLMQNWIKDYVRAQKAAYDSIPVVVVVTLVEKFR